MTRTVPAETLLVRLRASWRILAKEVAAFGLVGAIAFAVQIGLFNLLLRLDIGPLTSNGLAMIASTSVAYLGNRNFSFSHRARVGLARETGIFFGINAVTFVFSELLLALFAYPLGFKHDHFVINLVNLVSIGIGTLFRFWSYKRFVFLHPDRVHDTNVDLETELAE